jgi:hypothetical protein
VFWAVFFIVFFFSLDSRGNREIRRKEHLPLLVTGEETPPTLTYSRTPLDHGQI